MVKNKCLICHKELPKGRNKTCSKKCARTYGYSMDSKKRKKLRGEKDDKK